MSKEVYTTFTKDNVLAILAGRKWQTRRVIKPQPADCLFVDGTPTLNYKQHIFNPHVCDPRLRIAEYARWQPGDLMCVKEGYKVAGICGYGIHGRYLADDVPFDVQLTDAEWQRWTARKYPYRATSARFMYKSLCRIKQPVVRSWVEPVQDITPDDCEAEGITGKTLPVPSWKTGIWLPYEEYRNGNGLVYGTPREAFGALWDEINPKALFDSNVWVWATEFERRTQ